VYSSTDIIIYYNFVNIEPKNVSLADSAREAVRHVVTFCSVRVRCGERKVKVRDHYVTELPGTVPA